MRVCVAFLGGESQEREVPAAVSVEELVGLEGGRARWRARARRAEPGNRQGASDSQAGAKSATAKQPAVFGSEKVASAFAEASAACSLPLGQEEDLLRGSCPGGVQESSRGLAR